MDNQQRSISLEVYKQHSIYYRIEISNFGNVRDFVTRKPRYVNKNKQGYLTLIYSINNKRKGLKVHRLVAELFLPEPSDELKIKCLSEHWNKVLVKHKDNNKTNNHVSNLEWSDLRGNTKQAWNDSLIPKLVGSLNGMSVLTEEIVHNICKDYEQGMSPKDAVIKYGISKQQATKIRAGFQWVHISSQYNIVVKRRNKRSTAIETTALAGRE